MKSVLNNYANTLNRRLKVWDKNDIESNLVKETRENLEMFYQKYGIEADYNFFAKNLDLSTEAEREFENIMDSFGDKAESSYNEMSREYDRLSDQYKDRWDIESTEDFINFTDKMKQHQNDRILKKIISSDQIAELYTIASNMNISGDTVDDLIMFEYQSQQAFYERNIQEGEYNANDPLYNNMLRILEDYGKMDNPWNSWD